MKTQQSKFKDFSLKDRSDVVTKQPPESKKRQGTDSEGSTTLPKP